MKIPVTGTVKGIRPFTKGDPDDPIRLIDIDLGNVSWKLISLDLENEEMEIEITPNPETEYDTGGIDGEGNPIFAQRPATQEEKDARIENARNFSLERVSKEDLYTLSKSPKLINPFK